MKTADEIVRALAATPEPVENDYGMCDLCCVFDGDRPHKTTCPWRLAREWVAANPAPQE